MLAGRLKTSFFENDPIAYVGSVTKAVANESGWDSSAEALDVLSLASVGDLVVIAFTYDLASDDTWTWQGMSFTTIYDGTNGSNVGYYLGYHFIESGDANPYVTGVITNSWYGLTVVASVFSGALDFVNDSLTVVLSDPPDVPSLTASGGLWVAAVHCTSTGEWDIAPSGYSMGGSVAYDGGSDNQSTTSIAYKIAALSSDNPGAFTRSVGGTTTSKAYVSLSAFSD